MWVENLLVQLLGLAGFGLLAVPAFHAAKYGRLVIAARKNPPGEGDFGQEAYKTALKALQDHRDSWTAWKGYCLAGGTLVSIASYLVAVHVAWYSPAAGSH
jgi:hypothetical protein